MEQHDHFSTLEKRMMHRAAAARCPINGSMELTPVCNMNCDMCYVRLSPREMAAKGRLRTADEWIALGREMVQCGTVFLLLTGGEPLLFPDFRRLYLELKKMGMILTINTNGTLLDEEWADFFAANKPRRINITLYGGSEEAYKRLCHYSGGFEKTLRAIKLLKARGVDVKINGSVTPGNWADMDEIYRIGRELNAPVHMDTYMVPAVRERSKPYDQQARLRPEDAAAARLAVLKGEYTPEAVAAYAARMLAAVRAQEQNHPDCVSCLAGNCSFTINWMGEMRPCVVFPEIAAPVFETGFAEAWKYISEEAHKPRLNEKCVHCSLRSVCNTCVASAHVETGAFDGIPDYLCRYGKEFVRLLEQELSPNA